MGHFPSSLPRVTKEDNRNLILLENISPIGVKMGAGCGAQGLGWIL